MEFLLPGNIISILVSIHIFVVVMLMMYYIINAKRYSKRFIIVSLFFSIFIPFIGVLGSILYIVVKEKKLKIKFLN